MPEKIEDNSWKNSSLRRRNSDPVCYVTTDEDADVGFKKLYEDTLQDLLQKVRKEDKTTNDLQGFLNHQQNYVDKLLKEIKHLKEEKQKMSFELFAAKMEVEILKKQQLCIYEPGYITGLVQELQKASSERADILSSYCDKVQSLAYQKSQPFVPYNNQNYQSTFRPYQNGYQNYNNAYTTGPYTNMNGAQPPRVYGSYSMPPYFAECDRPTFKGNYGMPSSSPLSSLSPASNSFGHNHPQISPQLSKEARLFGYPLELVNPDMNGFRPLQDMVTQQMPCQVQAPSQNGQSWGNHCIPPQLDPWRQRTESAPNQMLVQHEDQKKDTPPPAQKPIQQDKIKKLENEVDRLKEMYAQLYKLVPKDVVEVPKGDISQSTSKQIPCNHTSVVNKPLVLSLNASNETEDLPEGEKEALLLLDRALADHSGGSISSEEVFEESDKNSGSSGSPYLRSKPRSSPRCGVSSLIETKSKDFPFNFIRNRENKLVRSQSDSEPVCHSSAVKPFNSYVKVLSKATDL